MKRLVAIVCLIMVTMSSALAQAKDVTNNKSNIKSFKSTAWLLLQPVLIIGTYDKEGKSDHSSSGQIIFCPSWRGQASS